MGCLKLTYRSETPTLKVVRNTLKESEKPCAGAYRFGFNGQEKDDEVYGISGSWYDYGERPYMPLIGRFPSPDPLIVSEQKYPYLLPYQYASLNPIRYVDIDGLEAGDPPKSGDKPKVKVVSKSEVNVTIGPQAELGAKGGKGKGLGLDLTIVNFNILKISITETVDLNTGETDSDWSFDWFSGDVESSVGVKYR